MFRLRRVPLEADAPPDLLEVRAPHAAVLGVVAQQVRQLGPRLHEVEPREPAHLVVEAGDAEQLAQQAAGVVEGQRLVEVADEQVVSGHAGTSGAATARANLRALNER
jgi:hypothetical protein